MYGAVSKEGHELFIPLGEKTTLLLLLLLLLLL
jgi:hypothetical protein